jgi:hypothetical protein
MKKLLFGMTVGAALAWLFDPDTGSRRRMSIRRKLEQRGVTAPAVSTNHTPAAVATIP